jgi:hypothetical protein
MGRGGEFGPTAGIALFFFFYSRFISTQIHNLNSTMDVNLYSDQIFNLIIPNCNEVIYL